LFCLNAGNCLWAINIDIDNCRLTCQVFCINLIEDTPELSPKS
jgi:hypothetical protein